MKFRFLITFGVSLLLLGVLAASLAALTKVMGDAALTQVGERLDNDAKVLRETWNYRQKIQRSEVRVVAEEPRLKAVVGSDDVGQATIDGVVAEMREAMGSDLFVLTDGDGTIIVDANHPDAAGQSMGNNPLIDTALEKGGGSAVWVEAPKVYQVHAERLAFGQRGIGVLVTGRLVGEDFANAVHRQTGAGVVVELNGELVARSPFDAAGELTGEQVAALISNAPSGAEARLRIGDETFLVRAENLPGYSGKHRVRYAIVRSLDRALAPARQLTNILYGVLGAALLIGIGFALWLSTLLSRPLEQLVQFARALGTGDLRARAKEAGPREVRTLATAMNSMAGELERSREQLAEKERLEREMEIAEKVQTSMLPKTLSVRGYEIAADMLPADEVGGDYYDVIPTEDGCWLGVGDVAGHGLPAGIIMMMIQTCVGSLTRACPEGPPARLVGLLNRVIHENVRHRLTSDEHVTFTLLRLREDGGVVHAGAHEEIIVLRAQSGEVERIQTTGTWLGARPDIEKFTKDETFKLEPGDLMLLYTDGIIEGKNAAGEEFGLDRLVDTLRSARERPLEEIRKRVFDVAADWMESQVDDITVLVLQYTGATR